MDNIRVLLQSSLDKTQAWYKLPGNSAVRIQPQSWQGLLAFHHRPEGLHCHLKAMRAILILKDIVIIKLWYPGSYQLSHLGSLRISCDQRRIHHHKNLGRRTQARLEFGQALICPHAHQHFPVRFTKEFLQFPTQHDRYEYLRSSPASDEAFCAVGRCHVSQPNRVHIFIFVKRHLKNHDTNVMYIGFIIRVQNDFW